MRTAEFHVTSKFGVRIYLGAGGAFLFLNTESDCLLAHHKQTNFITLAL
jgi:hypothetical protein